MAAGSIVIESTPFVHCLTYPKKELFCDFCFKQCSKLSRCSKCKFMFYCSPDCQKTDWIIHKSECNKFVQIKTNQRYESTLKSDKARFFLRVLIHYKINKASNLLDENGLKTFESLMDNYKSLMNDEIKLQDMTGYIILFQDFMGEDFILKFSEKELISCYGKMITNKFEIKNEEEKFGLGLYLSASSLDHSCEPNSDFKFDGTKIIVKLTRDLKPGETPLISYCDLSMNKQQKASFLKENYFFKCNCPKCVGIEPDFEIYLPCGFKIQYKELMYQTKVTDCVVCKNHKINIEECLDMEQNQLNINRRLYEVEIQKYEKTKLDIDSYKIKNEVLLEKEFDKLKNIADLKREELRKQIDRYYFKLLDEIETKRSVCYKRINEKANEINSFKHHIGNNTQSKEFYQQNLLVLEREAKILHNFVDFSNNEVFFDLKSNMDISNQNIMNQIFGQILFNEEYIKNNFKYEFSRKFIGHKGHVMRAQFIGHDKLISTCDDYTLRLWDINTCECLKVFKLGFDNPVCLIVKDDRHFLTDSPISIKLWDIDSGKCIKAYERNPNTDDLNDTVYCLKITQNGYLLCGSESGIEIWNLKSTISIKSIKIHSDAVYYFEETSNQLILSGSADKTIKLWDIEDKNPKKTYSGHREAIRVLKVINDEIFASGSRDKTVKIWNFVTRECLKTFEGYDYTVTFLDLIDNNFLMSCCVNGLIKIWNLDTGLLVMQNQTRKGEVCHLNKNKNEVINIGVNQDIIQIWKNKVIA